MSCSRSFLSSKNPWVDPKIDNTIWINNADKKKFYKNVKTNIFYILFQESTSKELTIQKQQTSLVSVDSKMLTSMFIYLYYVCVCVCARVCGTNMSDECVYMCSQ